MALTGTLSAVDVSGDIAVTFFDTGLSKALLKRGGTGPERIDTGAAAALNSGDFFLPINPVLSGEGEGY